MAQRVQVLVVCDLHGDDTPGTETIRFGIDGQSYEIDVCPDHATQLRSSLATYVGSARRVGSRRRGRDRRDGRALEIRAWARQRGIEISKRGRIPAHIVEQYDASHR